MKFFLLINVKMPTIVGILTFMSRKNSILNLPEPEKGWISWYFHTYEHLKFHAQLSWAWKKFYNLEAWVSHIFTVSNISTKASWPVDTKFHIEPPGIWETKILPSEPGHMTNMAAMPIHDGKQKNFNNLFQNQLTDGLETYMYLSRQEFYQNCTNDDIGLTGQGQISSLMLYMRNY